MAARADQNTDRVTFTGACPNPSAGFTLLGWIHPDVDLNAFSAIARASSGGATSFNFATQPDGTTLAYLTGGGTVIAPYQITPGQWTRFAIQQAGTTATIWFGDAVGPLSSIAGTVGGAANPDQITLFGRSAADGSEWFNGSQALVRYYSSVLTGGQIASELASLVPIITAGLFANWALSTGTDLADSSGNGRHLVAGSTSLSTAEGPPILHPVTSTLALDSSAVGSKIGAGSVSSPLVMFSNAQGEPGGGAEVSDVLCSPWATIADVPEVMRLRVAALTDDELRVFLTRASELLWMLSGRRWYGGGCTESATLRSHPPMPGQGTWPYDRSWPACACWSSGTWLDGRLYPSPGWKGRHTTSPIALRLPRSPITGIVSVTIDGDPFTDYHLLRTGWLERTDGQGWRMCDDSTVITYEYGEPPPPGGRDSAVELGIELALSFLGSDDCRLPERTVSVTRQGVSMTILDTQELLGKGLTGLPGVDLWISAITGGENRPQAAGVWSPDIPSTMRS